MKVAEAPPFVSLPLKKAWTPRSRFWIVIPMETSYSDAKCSSTNHSFLA